MNADCHTQPHNTTTFDEWEDLQGALQDTTAEQQTPPSPAAVAATAPIEPLQGAAQTTLAASPPASEATEDEEELLAPPMPPPPLPNEFPVQQIDVIVIDISGSMKSKSSIDPDQTREDCSKIVFHTFVDKMMALEMGHVLGLVAFGAEVSLTQAVTRDLEKFHDELGRLDANQSRTRLYDAIKYASDVALYSRQQWSKSSAGLAQDHRLRVFALTDGEDNASSLPPHELAAFLQEKKIVLDVFPLACVNNTLRAVCAATGGQCVSVYSVDQSVAVFEDEALLHCNSRVPSSGGVSEVIVRAAEDLQAIVNQLPPLPAPPVRTSAGCGSSGGALSTAQRPFVAAPTMTPTIQLAQSCSVVPTGSETQKMETFRGTISAAVLKRIMKELKEMQDERIPMHLCDTNCIAWKVVLTGPNQSPYEGGTFVLSVTFPNDYPFKPPKVVFLTPVYHCNVNSSGGICLDILKSQWSPALTIRKVVLSIQSMLTDPNADDPLDCVKAQLFRDNRAEYDRQAREFTARHASDAACVLAANSITLP